MISKQNSFKNLFYKLLTLNFLIFIFPSNAVAQVGFLYKNNPLVKQAQALYEAEEDTDLFLSANSLKDFQKKDAFDLLVWAAMVDDVNFKISYFKAVNEKSSSILNEFLALKSATDEDIFRLNAVGYCKALATGNLEDLTKTTIELKKLFDKSAKPLYNIISYGLYASYQGGSQSFKLNDIADFVVKNATKSSLNKDHFFVLTSEIGSRALENATIVQQAIRKRRLDYSVAIIDKMAAFKSELMPELLNLLWGEAHWVTSPQERIKVRKDYINELNRILGTTAISFPNTGKVIKEARILYTMFHDNQANQSALVEEFIKLQPTREVAFNKIITYLNNLPYDGTLELLSPKNITWDKHFKDLISKVDDFNMKVIFRHSSFLEDYLASHLISENLIASNLQKINNSSIADMVDFSDPDDFNANYLNERIGSVMNKLNKIRMLTKYNGSSFLSRLNVIYTLSYNYNYLMINNTPASNFPDLIILVKSLTRQDIQEIGSGVSATYVSEFSDLLKYLKGKLNTKQEAQVQELILLLKSKFSLK